MKLVFNMIVLGKSLVVYKDNDFCIVTWGDSRRKKVKSTSFYSMAPVDFVKKYFLPRD
jgi:hypothetical protein